MRRQITFFTLLISLGISVSSLAGTVHTLSGKSLVGLVSITAQGQLLVNQTDGNDVVVAPQDVLEATFREIDQPPIVRQGVLLTDGTLIAGDILSADEASVHYARDGREFTVPMDHIARIYFKPVPAKALADLSAGRYGAVLANGDFFAGDFKGMPDGRVKIESLIFGVGQFAPDTQVAAVIVADVRPARSDWIVHLSDGSVLMAASVKLDRDTLIVEDLTQGTFTLAPKQVINYHCGLNRLQPLEDLKPRQVEPSDEIAIAVDQTTAGVPMRLLGTPADRGVGMSAGATAAYALDGQYLAFLCHAGVPSELVPTARVRFIVLADGKEVYRSDQRTSIDDALSLSLPVAGVKSLELKVQSEQDADLGAHGLWADASLVKIPPKPAGNGQ